MRTRQEPSTPFRKCLPFVRPPAVGSIVVEPIQDQHTIVVLHRFQGRSLPCLEPDCFLCEHRIKQEEKIFFLARRRPSADLVIVELPISKHDGLTGATMRHGTMRRFALHMKRKYPANNAPVVLSIELLLGAVTLNEPASLIDELAWSWCKNVEFAADEIASKKTTSKFAPGCEIGGRDEA